MKIASLIPARLSSKRLQKKNIKKLNRKPLLFWSIDVALESDCFDTICVSTENHQVADLVRENYSKNDIEILMRPEELATDTADLRDVCRHFLNEYPLVDMLHLMMPTYPFRNPETIKQLIIPAIYSGQVERVVSVLPKAISTFDYWIKSKDVFIRMFKHQPLWCEAGNAVYPFMKRDYFYKEPHNWPYDIGERELKIQTNLQESIDIDTQEDWNQAEKSAAGYIKTQKKLAKQQLGWHEFVVPEGTDVSKFRKYILYNGCDINQPVLILDSPPPYFTFLRLHATGNRAKDYQQATTRDIIANLPASGHSQDFPEHFIHSSYYRVLRANDDSLGIIEEAVPENQVIFYSELKQLPWFIDPCYWKKT
jgi:CMP-N-acetylneuraminic acid synthetase